MAIDNFTPTIWANSILRHLEKVLIFGQSNVVNRDYEGEIGGQGDTVKINAIGPVTVGTYSKNTNISDPETLNDAQSTLVIDQAKYFNFQVDDIDQAQNKPAVMDEAMRRAGYALKNTIDQFLATTMSSGLASVNTLGTTGTPLTLSAATDAYNKMVDLKTILDENNVPDEGRWIIVPAWFEGLMLKDDRFVRAPISSPNTNVILNGQIRFAAGFNILMSNNLTKEGAGAVGDYYYVIAGTNLATSYAEQIVEVEAYRPEKRFADAVKGLNVYGAKVIRPEALAALIVDRPNL